MALLAATCLPRLSQAEDDALVEGVRIENQCLLDGTRLVLNGSAVRKRGYFNTELVALYLPSPQRSLESILRAEGPKRVQFSILKELNGAALSRIFINDFKAESVQDEFKVLINEVAEIGGYFGQMKTLFRGDVVTVDWIPQAQGFVTSRQGKPLGPPMKRKLMFEIILRMFVVPRGVPQAYRDAMLGIHSP